jgi:hypothetical protein
MDVLNGLPDYASQSRATSPLILLEDALSLEEVSGHFSMGWKFGSKNNITKFPLISLRDGNAGRIIILRRRKDVCFLSIYLHCSECLTTTKFNSEIH